MDFFSSALMALVICSRFLFVLGFAGVMTHPRSCDYAAVVFSSKAVFCRKPPTRPPKTSSAARCRKVGGNRDRAGVFYRATYPTCRHSGRGLEGTWPIWRRVEAAGGYVARACIRRQREAVLSALALLIVVEMISSSAPVIGAPDDLGGGGTIARRRLSAWRILFLLRRLRRKA